MTGWGKWSTGNCARNENFTIWTNGWCKTQNLSEKMRRTKIFCGFEIHTDSLISAIQPNLVKVKKKKVPPNSWHSRSGWPHWRKLWNVKVTVIPNVIGAPGIVTKGLVQELEYMEIGRSGNHRKFSIVEIAPKCYYVGSCLFLLWHS